MKPPWQSPTVALPSSDRRGSSSPQYPGLTSRERSQPSQRKHPTGLSSIMAVRCLETLRNMIRSVTKTGGHFWILLRFSEIPNGSGGIGKLRCVLRAKNGGLSTQGVHSSSLPAYNLKCAGAKLYYVGECLLIQTVDFDFGFWIAFFTYPLSVLKYKEVCDLWRVEILNCLCTL